MKNFKGGGGFGGGQRFGGGNNKNHERNGGGKFGGGQSRGFKGGDRSQERSGEMFSAVCSTCGKPCEVPFRPSPDKPVYCSACFGKKSQEMSREFGSKDKGARREPEFKRDSRPSRDERPARNEQSNDGGHEELKRQLSSLEGKVNRILDMLNAQMHEQPVEEVAELAIAETPKKERKPKKVKAAPKKAAKKTSKTVAKKTKK